MKKIVLLPLLLLPLLVAGQKKYTVSGYVNEKGSKESLLGVTIYVKEYQTGTVTNAYGFYSITLPEKDSITLIYSCVGFVADTVTFGFHENRNLNIELAQGIALQEVVVRGERTNSELTQMSTVKLMPKEIKSIPMLLGEKDVFKTLMLMPGVSSGTEGTSGMYVRGGGPDQNLVILDEATIYNPSHLLGFFSIFNGDAIKSIELTKGGFPARYGGRLSSIIDVNMKEGNKQSYHGEGGIGILAAHAMVEGPIVKNKSSFMISARRTYFDLLARPILAILEDGNFQVGYFFFDLNAKLNYDFGDKNKLYVSGYWGRDKFYLREKYDYEYDNSHSYFDAGLYWQNAAAVARWNHLFSSKLFSNLSFIFSDYTMDIYSKEEYKTATYKDYYNMDYYSGIRDYTLKYDFTYTANPNHTILMGANATLHQFSPSALTYADSDTSENLSQGIKILGLEAAIYAEDEMRIGKKFKINPGFRMALFSVRGKTYFSPEPRLSMSYNFLPNLAAKASYAMMQQNIHLLSTSTIGLPTDLWVPSTSNIVPQKSQQVALGLAYDLKKPQLSFSLEGYYKTMNNMIAYKEGTGFFFFDVIDGEFDELIDYEAAKTGELIWEKNLARGKGWAYGMEFLVRKSTGKFTGWIGYTLSWATQQFDELNFGKKFYARYDRRHDVSVVLMYELNKRISFSAAWVFASGNAVTIPQSIYYYETMKGSMIQHITQNYFTETGRYFNSHGYGSWDMVETHGERNNFRTQPFHHLDVGIQIKTKPNRKWKWDGIWEISVYNVYNHKNAFFYFMDNVSDYHYDEQTGERVYEGSRTLTDEELILAQLNFFPFLMEP